MNVEQKPLVVSAQTLRLHADRYDHNYDKSLLGDDNPRLLHTGDEIRSRKYVLINELHAIAKWKSPRRADLVKDNPPRTVKEVTRSAIVLMDTHPDYAVSLLTVLHGIGPPTASAVLTVADPRNFGIIDVRAWRTLSRWQPERFPRRERSGFTAREFLCYLETIRHLAKDSGLSCREVDMALWHMAGKTQS